MNVRWRLMVLALQLCMLCGATFELTGRPYSSETWFTAGLLALIVNPQLLEPYYPRPADVVVNCIIGIVLYLTTARNVAIAGWNLLVIGLALALVLGLIALVFGAGRRDGRLLPVARFATILTRSASSRVIYSAIYWLAVLEFRSVGSNDFWLLTFTWVVVTGLGLVNWQAAWSALSAGPMPCTAEGMMGPSLLLLSSASLPSPGTAVRLRAAGHLAEGVVLNRIHRGTDFWGQVHIADLSSCESFARASMITIESAPSPTTQVVGVVLPLSTDSRLQFLSAAPLSIGTVVAVRSGVKDVYYQIRWAEIEESKVKGGAHQVVRAHASQLGIYEAETERLRRYPWVPTPGGAVMLPPSTSVSFSQSRDGRLTLGTLVGTQIPIFLDSESACHGHIAILGMTRMGKTTLALRLALELAKTRRVTVLDQTGEWVTKQGLPQYTSATEDSHIGLSVMEPKPGSVPADEALKYLKSLVNLAYVEYRTGVPLSRVLIIDEAHQFVPEPAGLGFNAPGRDSSAAFGLLMMQVRKYGITILLVSQRTAVVAKSALSQCENLIAFKNVDQTGLEYLEAILGADARHALPALQQGEALAFGPAISSDMTAGIQVVTS